MQTKKLLVVVAIALFTLLGGTALAQTVSNLSMSSTSGNFDHGDDLSLSYSITSGTHGRENWKLDGSSYAWANMPFEGNDGSESSQSLDISGSTRNGTVSGATYSTTGGYDSYGAYTFDSVDFISLPNFNPGEALTISLRFNVTDKDAAGAQEIVSKAQASGYLLDLSGGNLRFAVHVGGTYHIASFSNAAITNGQWHTATGVYDGETVYLYLDGTEVATQTSPSGSITTDSRPVCIGAELAASTCDGGGNFIGMIDEVLFFNRVLSPGQIESISINGYNSLDTRETFPTDSWVGCVTPFDTSDDSVGSEFCTGAEVISWDGVSGQILSPSSPLTDSDDLTASYTINDGTHGMVNWLNNSISTTKLYLPMDGENRDEATQSSDISGNGNNGTVSGNTVWHGTGGHNGYGYYEFFSGNDRIQITDDDSLDGYSAMTIALWIKPDAGMSSWNGMVCKYNSDSGGDVAWRLSREGPVANQDKIEFVVAGSASSDQFYSTETLTAGYIDASWHFVVVTWDGATKTAQFYKDGVADGPAQVGSGPSQIINSGDPVWIGDCYSTAQSWNGGLDDVMVFDKALSAEQVASMYTESLDTWVAEETEIGDLWKANVFSYDNSNTGAAGTGELTTEEAILAITVVPEFSTWLLIAVLAFGFALIIQKNLSQKKN